MNNKQLIVSLKQIFDSFDLSTYAYVGKHGVNGELYISQNKNDRIISHKVENLTPINFTYIIITPKDINKIKQKLDKLYTDSIRHNIFVEIKLLANGLSYKVYNMHNKNKLLYKDRIKFKSSFSMLFYLIHILRGR